MTPIEEHEERYALASKIDEFARFLWNQSYEDWEASQGYGESNPAPIEVLREYAAKLEEFYDAETNRMMNEPPENENEIEIPVDQYRLKNLWRRAYQQSVHEQPVFCEMDYYTFIGQWFKSNFFYCNQNEEDLRIHNVKIADSGTGKTESNNFLAEVCKEALLTIEFPGRINDASIIGSYDKEIAERNRKKGREEGNPDWENPVIYGVLKNYDFVVFDEAERVLKPSSSTEQLQVTLQAAMNRMGSAGNIVSNTLVKGKVSYNAQCSIVLTSYYLEEIRQTLVEKGLIQRMLFYNQEPNIDLRKKIERKILDSVVEQNVFVDQVKIQKDSIKRFVHHLRSISQSPKRIRFSKEVIDRIEFYNSEMRAAAQFAPKGQQSIFNGILARGLNKMMKLSALNALSEGRDSVTIDDVEEMYPLIKMCNMSVLGFISDNIETRMDVQLEGWLQDVKERIGKQPMPKGTVNQIMMTHWKRGKNTAIERLKKISDYYTITDKEGEKIFQLK